MTIAAAQHAPILLAEDNAREAELVLRAMTKCPFACSAHWVRDGVEALEVLFTERRRAAQDRTYRPKLVLLDLNMPRLDGFGVLRALRAQRGGEGIPVVMMTSSGEERDIAQSYALGASSFVVKPADPRRLTETVVALCRYWIELNRIPAT